MSEKKKQKEQKSFLQKIEDFSRNKIVVSLLLLIVSIVFFVNYNALYDKKFDINGDNIYYFALGKAIHDGKGYTNTLYLEESPHTHFPPGYSAFISVVMKIWPEDIQAVKKANGVLLYASILLIFFIVLKTTKNSILAFGVSLLISLHTHLLRLATIMMSETLFIFVSLLAIFLALLLMDWDFGKRKKWGWIVLLILLGGVVAYIYFVRTIGVSVILAILGWYGIMSIVALVKWRKSVKTEETEQVVSWKRMFISRIVVMGVVLLGFGTAVLAWQARNESIGFTGGTSYTKDFAKKPNGEVMTTKEDWINRIKSNTPNFLMRWLEEDTYFHTYDKDQPVSGKEWVQGSLFCILLILGMLYVSYGQLMFLFYIGLTVAVLILYPEQYGGTRYLHPVVPLLIFFFLNGCTALIAVLFKLFKRQSSPWLLQSILVLCLVFGWLSPLYSKNQKDNRDMTRSKSWAQTPDPRLRDFVLASEWCAENLPDTARVICRKPEIYYMCSHFHKSSTFPYYGEPDTIYEYLKKINAEYLIIDNWFRHAYHTLYPCVRKYPDKFSVVKQFGEINEKAQLYPTLILRFNDEWGYTGEQVNGVAEGQGQLVMQDGRCYKGSFSAGKPNGVGSLYDSNGKLIREGTWKDGVLVR